MNNYFNPLYGYNFLNGKTINHKLDKALSVMYKEITNKFLKYLNEHKIKEIVMDKYCKILFIDDKYIIAATLFYKKTDISYLEKFNTENDMITNNDLFFVVFENLIYDEKFDIDINSFVKKMNNFYESDFIKYYEVNQYLDRTLEENSLLYDNDDKFHSFAQKMQPTIDLYEMLANNQLNQTITDNLDFSNACEKYNIFVETYKNYLLNYDVIEYSINDYEKVFVIDDSLVLYFGLKGNECLFKDKDDLNIVMQKRYSIIIQELTYNSLYGYDEIKKIITDESPDRPNVEYYTFIIGNDNKNLKSRLPHKITTKNNFDYVDKLVPQINLRKRFNDWEGLPISYIVYEMKYNNKIGYATSIVNSMEPNQLARMVIKRYEEENGYLGDAGYTNRLISNFHPDKSWKQVISDFINDQVKEKWTGYKTIGEQKSLFAERINYFIVTEYSKNEDKEYYKENEVIQNAINNKYDDIERITYDITPYKWKSEELVLDCVRKVFKNNKVVHQYRPYFLHTKKGQLSYDVYVCGKKIAFEYQGEQHFKAIDYFGGEETLKKQQQRDELKRQLSEENKVKLIYINYWETISVDLIKEKLKENK